MANFYDKIAKKLGGYGFANDGLEYRSEYPTGEPEKIFLQAVLRYATKDSIGLDIGCGDGIFSFQVSDAFARIEGIDNSKELIRIARQKQAELGLKQTHFLYGDASKMPYPNDFFDVAFNRRGPSFYKEYSRVLKKGGFYIEVGIGEQDAQSLKEIFERGQDFGAWTMRRIERDTIEFLSCGLRVIRAEDYFYKEFYPSREMFETFLEGVPIFEDFDRAKDAHFLDTYCRQHANDRGEIELDRHRVVYVLEKS